MNSRTFVCIVCPNGCTIEAQYEDDKIYSITGNKCKKGVDYVRQELIDPRRTISSSVRIEGAVLPLCSVRLINKITLTAPVEIGQVVIKNVCGLESDVIVTKNMGGGSLP